MPHADKSDYAQAKRCISGLPLFTSSSSCRPRQGSSLPLPAPSSASDVKRGRGFGLLPGFLPGELSLFMTQAAGANIQADFGKLATACSSFPT